LLKILTDRHKKVASGSRKTRGKITVVPVQQILESHLKGKAFAKAVFGSDIECVPRGHSIGSGILTVIFPIGVKVGYTFGSVEKHKEFTGKVLLLVKQSRAAKGGGYMI
jgi:hypothetical protein